MQSLTHSLTLGLIALLALSGCVRPADFDLETDARLGITCFLAPDQTEIVVQVYQPQTTGSRGGILPAEFAVPDAEVLLFNLTLDQSLAIPFDPELGWYQVATPPGFLESEASYRLEVRHDRWPDASGTCRIPTPPTGFEVALDSVPDDSRFEGYRYSVRPQWTDPPEPGNRYRLIGEVIRGDKPFFFRWEGTEADNDFISDEDLNSNTVVGPTGNLQAYAKQISGRPGLIGIGSIAAVDLLHVTEDYFRFQLDIRQARLNDPLISEPYFIHSNLDGAEGVFTAYAKVSKRLRIR